MPAKPGPVSDYEGKYPTPLKRGEGPSARNRGQTGREQPSRGYPNAQPADGSPRRGKLLVPTVAGDVASLTLPAFALGSVQAGLHGVADAGDGRVDESRLARPPPSPLRRKEIEVGDAAGGGGDHLTRPPPRVGPTFWAGQGKRETSPVLVLVEIVHFGGFGPSHILDRTAWAGTTRHLHRSLEPAAPLSVEVRSCHISSLRWDGWNRTVGRIDSLEF